MHSIEITKLVKRLYDQHNNYREVARLMGLPLTTVHRLANKDTGILKARRGPKFKLSDRDTRKIKRVVNSCANQGQRCSSRTVQVEANLHHVSPRTVRYYLNRIGFVYKKVAKEIIHTDEHKKTRMALCREWVETSVDWKSVIFTDEKRFTLDGPDSWSTYMDPARKMVRDRVRCGGGGLMFWGMISSSGLLWIKFLDGKVDSSKYIEVLREAKGILDDKFGDGNYILQQDNCPIHTSAKTRQWLQDANMHVLKWPAKSPDLNIIENIWNYMSCKVYEKKVKFASRNELKNEIEKIVRKINEKDRKYVENLYASIPKRLLSVIDKKGAIIDY